mgnify:CR=1 FL=1
MKSEINATIAKYEKENAMWRCTINRKTSPLNSPYTEITDEWLRETPTKTNLKNALVADIDADGIIYKSIMEYVQLLNEKSADITLPLASVCSCKVTARVKAQNSIEFKIQNYKTERHEFGKIPINKCINDLFGIRIFLREPLTFDEVYSFIEDTYPNRYRCIDSSKLFTFISKRIFSHFRGSCRFGICVTWIAISHLTKNTSRNTPHGRKKARKEESSMIKHYIIMSSSYTDGSRVALDITEDRFLNSKAIAEMIEEIRKNCGKDVPLSTHFIETESASWDSVVAYDPFFEDVECTKSTTAFSEKIKKGRVLSGLDVANYILSKIRCTHLSLEKLVYYAYADYLCEHSERLFEDHIYAFRHGPVINSVYETFKRSGPQYVKPFEFGDDSDIRTGVKELPARSRILFAKEGTEKLSSIDRTIAKYGKYSAGALVDLTHRAGTPWSYVDSSVAYQEISDNLIMAYHHVESV